MHFITLNFGSPTLLSSPCTKLDSLCFGCKKSEQIPSLKKLSLKVNDISIEVIFHFGTENLVLRLSCACGIREIWHPKAKRFQYFHAKFANKQPNQREHKKGILQLSTVVKNHFSATNAQKCFHWRLVKCAAKLWVIWIHIWKCTKRSWKWKKMPNMQKQYSFQGNNTIPEQMANHAQEKRLWKRGGWKRNGQVQPLWKRNYNTVIVGSYSKTFKVIFLSHIFSII